MNSPEIQPTKEKTPTLTDDQRATIENIGQETLSRIAFDNLPNDPGWETLTQNIFILQSTDHLDTELLKAAWVAAVTANPNHPAALEFRAAADALKPEPSAQEILDGKIDHEFIRENETQLERLIRLWAPEKSKEPRARTLSRGPLGGISIVIAGGSPGETWAIPVGSVSRSDEAAKIAEGINSLISAGILVVNPHPKSLTDQTPVLKRHLIQQSTVTKR